MARSSALLPLLLPLLGALAVPAAAQKLPGASQAPRLPVGQPLEDCNANGVPDIRDILSGTSADCQVDGVPDECQDDVEGIYLHDDWVLDGGAGWGFPHYAWLTAHYARPGQEVITEVELAWGQLPPGTPVTIGLWSDPDGDGKPYDAQVLVSVPAVAEFPMSGKLVRVDIPDTYVGPAGTPFFVGAYGAFDPADYPLGFDYATASLHSWIVMSNVPIQPDDLQAGAAQFAILGDADWILRGISCPSGHCGEITDADFDGIPDQCQPQDCNGNGVPDDQDIALGTSADCQLDGIPDECQVGAGSLVYAQDDGEIDTAVGTNHSYYAWLNRFVVQPGGETVTDIEVAWGAALPGSEVTVGLWSDPNGDGDPTDAQLIQGFQTLTTYEFTGEWVSVNIPDTYVGAPGTSFFVGAYGFFEWDPTGAKPTWYAAGLDTDQPDLQAWFVSSDAPIDLDDLSAGAAEYGRLNTVCSCDGDWTIRAVVCPSGHCGESNDVNANGVPDECEADCDGDGLPDDYEIQTGLDTDCNGNGLPDSCEMLADCDGNSLPDLCQSLTPDGLAAEYYATPDLSGDALARIDPQILFDFVATPPFPGSIPATGFSVRWTGAVRAPTAGIYTFGLVHDDGARLWVNGRLVIDAWQSSAGAAFDTGTIELPAGGEYLVRLEYFQDDGGALMELHWQIPGGTLQPMLSSQLRPIYDRNGDGVPDTCQLASDCNGNGVEDADDIATGTSLDCDANGVPDDCQRCDDADGNGLLDSCELAGGPGLVGQYFRLDPADLELSTPVFTRVDPQVDFDWGTGAPVGLPTELFGARWTGTLTAAPVSGNYTLSLQVDSGARLWLDGVLLIDGWTGPGTYTVSVNIAALTPHLLRLDYRETGGNASIRLGWTPPGGSPQVIPASALAPDTDLNGDGVPDLALADCNLNGIPDPLDPDLNANCVPDDCEGGAGYWRFEEAGGSTAVDATGNGLDGTLNFYPFRTPEVPLGVIPQTGAVNTQALDNGWIGAVTVPDVGGLLRVPHEGFTLEAWVQLDSLGFNNGNPNARQWLFMKKPPAASDALLEYAFLVQAGDLGGSGRELAFRYGDGVDVETVVSSISITDLDWHFVSVAYDPARRELRFGLDGQFETVPFSKPLFPAAGNLMLGAHENQNGQNNQWLFGRYDEPRFTRAFLPPEALLD